MFNNTSGGKDFQAKQEGDGDEPMLPRYTSSSRQWAGFKNPRIVRVSKAFGGKDRHSKVYTVKGLRDRRIRLSGPTAIQLYDLQDRLGLNQPSKVIDWLLDATKDDIDQLPPLQMLPEDFNQFHRVLPPSSTPQEAVENKWNKQENGDGNRGLNLFPVPQYSYPFMFPYNPYYNWEPSSNLSISQFGNQGRGSSQTDSLMSLPFEPHFSLCPPSAITQSPYPPYLMPSLREHHDLIRQNNHFPLLSSSSQDVPSNSLMPRFNVSDSQEKIPFALDARLMIRSHKNDDR
ncbi:uncharacterized protein LOC143552833 [Bidens hawaiensis]|uniref:uncharacterized protein LOC143552833 n=1 Tax=Bidens hawaiensis TaxID=980011 RepID=UPI004048ECE8